MSNFLAFKSNEEVFLSDLLLAHGVDFAMPCAGNHTCGKCKIRSHSGLLPISDSERRFLSETEITDGIRLACFAKTAGDVLIDLDEIEKVFIVSDGLGEIADGFAPLMPAESYGLAIDIGTTSVVCSIYSGKEPRLLKTVSALNKQRRFGSDVISRIQYGTEHSPACVGSVIHEQLRHMIDELRAQIPAGSISHAVVTGNTTMLHFFAGLDPKGIGSFPFTPQSLFDCDVPFCLPELIAYLPPCVGPYIGADLLCCILASGMTKKDGVSCAVDIGTNGEVSLFKNGKLYCCSTAAGPAFEGGNISCGIPAYGGAISKVVYDHQDGVLRYETADHRPPVGICGSGLIDCAAALLSCGALDETGRLCNCGHPLVPYLREENDELRFVFPNSNVYVSQSDIRQLQLAKGAIFAGITTLLARTEVSADSLDTFYICGGFGKFINLESAEKIGLIPPNLRHKSVILGNGALIGAAMILNNKLNKSEVRCFQKISEVIELSAAQDFMEAYIGAMDFTRCE